MTLDVIRREWGNPVFSVRYAEIMSGIYAQMLAQALGQGRTLEDAAIAQAVAGTDSIVAAVAAKRIYVVSYVFTLSADGTAKFSDGTDDLSGAFDIGAKGGASVIGQPSSHLFKTHGVNRPLQIITTGGAARGHIAYFSE